MNPYHLAIMNILTSIIIIGGLCLAAIKAFNDDETENKISATIINAIGFSIIAFALTIPIMGTKALYMAAEALRSPEMIFAFFNQLSFDLLEKLGAIAKMPPLLLGIIVILAVRALYSFVLMLKDMHESHKRYLRLHGKHKIKLPKPKITPKPFITLKRNET